jgi:hypothetical protein
MFSNLVSLYCEVSREEIVDYKEEGQFFLLI